MSTAQYRLLAAAGGVLESGSGDVTVAGGVLELRPATGAALRIPSGRIAAVAEPEPFTIRIELTDGTVIELARLGSMRTQILAELRDARAEVAAELTRAVGEAVIFSGTTGGDSAQLHVFEDALIVIAADSVKRISFSFIEAPETRDYTVIVPIAGGDPVTITRLGRRTGEFAGLLAERIGQARSRTAAFLGSLLPGLDPMAQRAAAGLLRDGVAAPGGQLDAIHPDLSAILLRVSALADRLAGIEELAGRSDLAIGFKQVTSVRRAAVGTTPYRDPSVTPHIGQHDSTEGLFRGGLAGAMAAGMMADAGPGRGGFGGFGFGAPFGSGPIGYGGPIGSGGSAGYGGYAGPFGRYGDAGDYGGYWAYRALGAGMNWNNGVTHQMTPRADVSHGLLTPSTEDLAALTASGESPTVLAFALASLPGRGRVAYEVLNLPEPVTYVYQASRGEEGRAAINRALDDAGFSVAELHAAAEGTLTVAFRQDAASSPLTQGLVATIPHDPDWLRQLTGLLGG